MLSGGRPSAIGWHWVAGWSLPLALVLVFLKVEFQPTVTLRGAHVDPADLAILLAAVCALLVLLDEGLAPFAGTRWLWLTGGAFLLFILAASLYPRFSDSHYLWRTHLITTAKFAEYALLAPVTAVLVRDRRSLYRLLATVVLLTVAAALVAVLQFVGVEMFNNAYQAGGRQPSFTGFPELAALGDAAIAIGFLGVLWPGTFGRWMLLTGFGAGAVALVLSGAAEGGIALVAIAVAALLVRARRGGLRRRAVVTIAAVTALCAVGQLALRAGDITQFGRDIGILSANRASTTQVNTYSQRELMYYIALRVFEAHPLLGTGWQSMREQQVYSPFLTAAHHDFPSVPEQAFPAPQHTWAVDDAYIQALAELGLIGTALFLCFLGTGLWIGWTESLRDPPDPPSFAFLGFLWFVISIGIWTGEGLYAGVAYEALPFLAIGLVMAARAASMRGVAEAR